MLTPVFSSPFPAIYSSSSHSFKLLCGQTQKRGQEEKESEAEHRKQAIHIRHFWLLKIGKNRFHLKKNCGWAKSFTRRKKNQVLLAMKRFRFNIQLIKINRWIELNALKRNEKYLHFFCNEFKFVQQINHGHIDLSLFCCNYIDAKRENFRMENKKASGYVQYMADAWCSNAKVLINLQQRCVDWLNTASVEPEFQRRLSAENVVVQVDGKEKKIAPSNCWNKKKKHT